MTNSKTERLAQNWAQNAASFGEIPWEKSDDFRYYIEASIPPEAAAQIATQAQTFITTNGIKTTHQLPAESLHITLALPGRLGTHFQQNDLSYMQRTLENLTKQQEKITVELGNFNVFPNVLFVEVADSNGDLQALHERICQQIPFSQYPEYQYENYLPHVSVAYGAKAQDLSQVNRQQSPITCQLDQIVLGKVKVNGPNQTDREVLSSYRFK